MKIETKFDLGDKVWLVKRYPKHVDEACPGCNGIGAVPLLDGNNDRCPRCYGNKYQRRVQPSDWHVKGPWTVGNIQVSLFEPRADHEDRRCYMCHETGTGTGNLWHEEDLFASREEAQAEADARRERGDT
jgi:hypothetical protein